jgi:hypothetical protein
VGDTSTVRINPKKRTAVVWYHDEVDKKELYPVKTSWHAGCALRSGTKWTAQKFKEQPVDKRKKYKNVKWESGGTFSL